ncbi:transporter [Camelimonas fluminis]|uniref:SLC13 family permease n=1 Tax=Camelimonas fluminis TaxID=1576911 RepID=A0ABV7UGG7_9HYPH|nr:SLC13 family permease [Camelimonas fluminis]GHE62419.1 transporter [Camelimonas fluminis]
MNVTLVIFTLVYVAMAFGKLPGFRVDRTGAAVVGTLAMIVFGAISPKAAWDAVDYRTIGMLFGLMVVSSAFVVSGFYAWLAQRVATMPVSPPTLLAMLIVVGGVMAAVLTKDVVMVAMTPLLVSITMARKLNPVPFLLAFCFGVNTGSVGLISGSPQNMIVAQGLGLSFSGFMKVTMLPALLSFPVVWAVVAFMYRGRWALPAGEGAAPPPADAIPPLDKGETIKAGLVTLLVMAAFMSDLWPREIIALSAAGILLLNRKIASKDMLGQIDGNLLLLIMGLFVVNAALDLTGLPQQLLHDLRDIGVDLNNPVTLCLVGGMLSNVIGNNPTVMLLTPFLQPGADADALGAALAVGTGFFSNLVVFGSLAGIIVVEQAARCGVRISFAEFSRAGAPVTVCCLVIALAWIMYLT